MDVKDIPKLGPGFWPARVVVDAEGLGVNSKRARYEYNIVPDIIFLRNDGWTLGAPKQFERVAFEMWHKEWAFFVRRPRSIWVPMEKYGGPR